MSNLHWILAFGAAIITLFDHVRCQTDAILKAPFSPNSVSGKFKSCDELYQKGYNRSGVYPIYPNLSSSLPKMVLCYLTDNYAGTVVLYRCNGSQSFDKNYAEYKNGFGSVDTDYWLGLSDMYELAAKNGHTKLTIVLEDWVGNVMAVHYPYFNLGPASDDYRLDLSTAFYGPGPANKFNHMFEVKGSPFQTKDHYSTTETSHCADIIQAGWWYRSDVCTNALLTGHYYRSPFQTGYYDPKYPADPRYDDGIFWRSWRTGRYSLKYVTMALSTM